MAENEGEQGTVTAADSSRRQCRIVVLVTYQDLSGQQQWFTSKSIRCKETTFRKGKCSVQYKVGVSKLANDRFTFPAAGLVIKKKIALRSGVGCFAYPTARVLLNQ